MKFNTNAIKATLFSVLATASTAVFAHNEYPIPIPSPTPDCGIPTGTPNGGPSAVPEPSAWIAFAIGSALIAGLTIYNKTKAAKATN